MFRSKALRSPSSSLSLSNFPSYPFLRLFCSQHALHMVPGCLGQTPLLSVFLRFFRLATTYLRAKNGCPHATAFAPSKVWKDASGVTRGGAGPRLLVVRFKLDAPAFSHSNNNQNHNHTLYVLIPPEHISIVRPLLTLVARLKHHHHHHKYHHHNNNKTEKM